MSKITASELALLRSRSHSTKLWLSIYQPTSALACQYNSESGTIGAYVIPYDNVSTGVYTAIRAGMTMLVGTTPNKADLGRVRVRSATGSEITVAENGNINWTNDVYLTVLNFYEVWPILPYYVIENDEVICYKDYDITYTNQNNVLGTLVCMGPHHAGWKNDRVFYTASGTVSVAGDDPLFYNWTFEGGSPATATGITPGYVTYATPGHYTSRLTVTSTGTASDSSYRHVSIYDRPGEGTNTPILQWEFDGDLSGSRDEGGYNTTIRVFDSLPSLQDGALVTIFADDDYDGTIQSIGGNALNRSSIVFVGYILDGSIRYDYQTSSYTFDVASVTERMKMQEAPSISVDSVVSATSWYELKDMDVRRALYHYLKWHSTVLNLADVVYTGANTKFQYLETDTTSLYDALATFYHSALVSYVVADRQGTIWIEPGAEAINQATGTLFGYMDILRQDWMGEPEITDKVYASMSYLGMGGVGYSGAATGTSEAYITEFPGNSPAYFGSPDDRQGLILTSQEQLNTLVGNVYAYENARYPSIVMEMAGSYRNMDIAPLEQFPLTVYPDDTPRKITLFRKPFHISAMNWEYDPRSQVFAPVIEMHEITQGIQGITVLMPPAFQPNFPPDPPGVDDPPSWPTIPPIGLPNIPPITIPGDPPSDGDPLCIENMNANAVGPHIMSMGGIVSTNKPWTVSFPSWFWVRSGSAVNKTKILVHGCFQKFNCQTGWVLDPNPDWLEVYGYADWGVPIIDGVITTNGGCGTHSIDFSPPLAVKIAGIAFVVKAGYRISANPHVNFSDDSDAYSILKGTRDFVPGYNYCLKAEESEYSGHPAIEGEIIIPVGHPVDGACIRNVLLDGKLLNSAGGTEVNVRIEARGGLNGTVLLSSSTVNFLGDDWNPGKSFFGWDVAIGTHVYIRFFSFEPADPATFSFWADNIIVGSDGVGRRFSWDSILLYNWCEDGTDHL